MTDNDNVTVEPDDTQAAPLPVAVPDAPASPVEAPVPSAPVPAPPAPAPTTSTWAASQWHGRMLVDTAGARIGKLQDVYVDVETDQPMFATVKEGLWPGRHLTFVPLLDVAVEPEELRVAVTADRVSSAPDLELHGEELSQADESALYHHFQQNYVAPATPSGRRLARR